MANSRTKRGKKPSTPTTRSITSQRSASNIYAYVGGNPIDFVDPLGLEIAYANHHILANRWHSKIVITPANQAAWSTHPDFQNTDSNGNRYATIGGGPDTDRSILDGDVNRPRDVEEAMNNYMPLQLPCGVSEDEMIKNLLEMVDIYNGGRVPYTLFPGRNAREYNSNSFVNSIGQAAGFDMPTSTGANTPGYGNVIPPWFFGR